MKKKKIRTEIIRTRDSIIVLHIGPSITPTRWEDVPWFKKKMEMANEHLKNSVLPPGAEVKWRNETVK
jgi:hypothetical protein